MSIYIEVIYPNSMKERLKNQWVCEFILFFFDLVDLYCRDFIVEIIFIFMFN